MNCKIELGEKLDTASVPALCEKIRLASGQPVSLDGTRLRVLGGLAAQALVAASRRWQAEGHAFDVSASLPMLDDLRRLGLETDIQARGTQE